MAIKLKVKAKQWGSSLGFIIPSEIVKEQRIKEGDELEVEVQKVTDIEKLFRKYKRPAGMTAQQIKDEIRAGWHDEHDKKIRRQSKT
jgi:antitoxin component of MazEF toxin-antitoxin module